MAAFDPIFCYTAPGSDYPQFINVHPSENGIRFIVREPARRDGHLFLTAGHIASMELQDENALELAYKLIAHVNEKRVAKIRREPYEVVFSKTKAIGEMSITNEMNLRRVPRFDD